jgi:hypothetical protein
LHFDEDALDFVYEFSRGVANPELGDRLLDRG